MLRFADRALRLLEDRVDLGYRTRRGKPFRDMTVKRMLTCPSAIGKYAVNKTREEPDGKRVELPPEEWQMVAGESIVDASLWKAVQDALTGDGPRPVKAPTGGGSRHPLTPLVYCACGESMFIENRAKFVCRSCRRHIPVVDLEAIVVDEVQSYVDARQDLLRRLIETPEPVRSVEDKLIAARAELQDTEKQMTGLYELYMEGALTAERFGELHQPLEEKRATRRRDIVALERELVRVRRSHPQIEAPDVDLGGLGSRWPQLPLETRSTVLRSLFDRVVVGEGEIELVTLFPDTPLKRPSGQQPEPPTTIPSVVTGEATWIPLPKAGTHCPMSGLTRSMLNQLILPTRENGFNPPVKSIVLRREGNARGKRLIVWESLKNYLKSRESL